MYKKFLYWFVAAKCGKKQWYVWSKKKKNCDKTVKNTVFFFRLNQILTDANQCSSYQKKNLFSRTKKKKKKFYLYCLTVQYVTYISSSLFAFFFHLLISLFYNFKVQNAKKKKKKQKFFFFFFSIIIDVEKKKFCFPNLIETVLRLGQKKAQRFTGCLI